MSVSATPATTIRSESDRDRMLLEITNAIITSLEKEDLLHATFAALDACMRFDAAGIALLEPEHDVFRFFALEGDAATTSYSVGSIIERADSCFGHAAATQRAVLCSDLEHGHVFLSDDRLRVRGMRSYCTVPLVVRGRSEGALSVVSRRPGAYTEDDAVFLQKVANQLALAVTNMKAYEQIASLQRQLQSENRELREEVQQASFQVLQAEFAASMGRFAATLAHELNSPISALKSSVETTVSLARRQHRALSKERRATVEAELAETMLASATRLHDIVRRMERFTNIDRSEVLEVDLNALLEDAVELLRARAAPDIELVLVPGLVRAIAVRPQLVSAAFFNVLQRAIEWTVSGKIRVCADTAPTEATVELRLEAVELSREEVDRAFDPSFEARNGRISASNWELFSARQMIRAHGGDIEIMSEPGIGMLIRMRLAGERAKAGGVLSRAR